MPHQGKPDKFQSLLILLNPERKSDIEAPSLNPEILSEMIIRNNKSDVTDAEGNFIFRGKTTTAIRINGDELTQSFDKSLQLYLRQGYAASFNSDEIKSELNINSEHLMAFAEGMFRQYGIEIIAPPHKDQVWHIKLSDELAQDLGIRKQRYEITFDRLLASSRPQCEIMDLDNFIIKYILAKAKPYSFGGLSAAVPANKLNGSAIICSYLRWRMATNKLT